MQLRVGEAHNRRPQEVAGPGVDAGVGDQGVQRDGGGEPQPGHAQQLLPRPSLLQDCRRSQVSQIKRDCPKDGP